MTPDQIQLVTLVGSGAATLALAFFGAVQLYRERRRQKESKIAARLQLEGPAWVARRTAENVMREEMDRGVLEPQLLEVLRLAAAVGGADAEVGRQAFDEFLAALDQRKRLHWLRSQGKYDTKTGSADYSPEVRAEINSCHIAADDHFHKLIRHLEVFAPRREHEPALPPLDDSPQLESGE